MRLRKPALIAATVPLSAILSLAACVTINIYFPAAAAEKAADRIIDEVWQLQQKDTPKKADPATDKEPTK